MTEQWLQLLAVIPDHRFYSRCFGSGRFELSSSDLGEQLTALAERIAAAEGNDRLNLSCLQKELQREQAWLEGLGL